MREGQVRVVGSKGAETPPPLALTPALTPTLTLTLALTLTPPLSLTLALTLTRYEEAGAMQVVSHARHDPKSMRRQSKLARKNEQAEQKNPLTLTLTLTLTLP